MSFDFAAGEVLLVDKPLTWTSFDAVKKIRGAVKIKKVGHAGTLDPLATGLLIICTGKMTKQIDTFQGQEKEYTGTICLGKTTPSFDLETEVSEESPIDHITEEALGEAAKELTGNLMQVPPLFSAVKIDGKRAYKHARKGDDIELKSRPVEVKVFEITQVALPYVSFRIVCSKGTYIRSLARDFGFALQTGAHLTELRRTRIGDFTIEQALPLPELIQQIKEYHENLQNP
ncbi:tRNA pseudouridine(55) synthase TruB [Cytophagales bacterium LB-30]|uniref:tRNA pseudouridine synthase B n=1 Tax=Shiella aurantiaca TaxID=3058365 RepID=A0ABT8F4E1_9BACT|nr:tRNA pseudouridine(55) synthase TruB [Shiella aurantiaca]MDN4165316.1 tRNA pseudouridine(55) synthase TruB [Shiella aurantiaca]